ncbi:MAG: hypothetical protein ABEK36_04655 [Candidatus Aenigmatarchaeota archaeon]
MKMLNSRGIENQLRRIFELREEGVFSTHDSEDKDGVRILKGDKNYFSPRSLPYVCEVLNNNLKDSDVQVEAESKKIDVEDSGILELSDIPEEYIQKYLDEVDKFRNVEEAVDGYEGTLRYSLGNIVPWAHPEEAVNYRKKKREISNKLNSKIPKNDEFNVELNLFPPLVQLYGFLDPENVDLKNPIIQNGFSKENLQMMSISYNGIEIEGRSNNIYEIRIDEDAKADPSSFENTMREIYFLSPEKNRKLDS